MRSGPANLLAILLLILATAATITPNKPASASTAPVLYGEVPNALQQSSPGTLEVHNGWGKTHLRVYIAPSGSQAMDDAMRNAVELWYGSIKSFTARYGYKYLERLTYEITDNVPDVIMEYVDSLPSNYCGYAQWWYESGATVRATVKVSRSCVRSSIPLAYMVAAHEYGHVLGLGHSTNSRDIMYPYVGGIEKLSTLDIYALAVVYEWVQHGSFSPPSTAVVSLPSGMPYELIEPLSPRRHVRVFIQSELGKALLSVHDVAFSSQFELTAEREILYSNLTKHVFTGWSVNDAVSSSPTIRFRVTGDVDLVIKYETHYFVEVSTLNTNLTKWLRRGEKLELRADGTVPLGERERLQFKAWSDGVASPSRTVEVLGPLNLTAVYAREFYVTVSGTHIPLKELEGWYEQGSSLELKAPKELVWENRTRAVFSYWRGAGADKPVAVVVVDGPLNLTAVYRVQYFVEILSQQPVSHSSGWFDRGSTVTVNAEPVTRYAGDGVRYRFGGWVGWEGPAVELKVDGPKTIEATWVREYLLTVTNPVEKLETWVEDGRNVTVEAEQVLQVEEGRRYFFRGWAGDADGHQGLAIWLYMDRPRNVLQLYDEELLVRLAYEGRDGGHVDAEATIRHESGRSYTVGAGEFWALKGGYEVVSIIYKAVDVKASDRLQVEAPGAYKLPIKVQPLRLVVRDALNMPFAGAKVSVSNGEVVEAEVVLDRDGEALLEPITYKAVNARLQTAIFTYDFKVDPLRGEEEVRLPLTPTSTALLAAAALTAVSLLYLPARKRKGGRMRPPI